MVDGGFKMRLVIIICELCPHDEVDKLISTLLNLFDTRVTLMQLLKCMIDREINHTGMPLFTLSPSSYSQLLRSRLFISR